MSTGLGKVLEKPCCTASVALAAILACPMVRVGLLGVLLHMDGMQFESFMLLSRHDEREGERESLEP